MLHSWMRLTFLLALAVAWLTPIGAEPHHLRILSTNDLHGQLEPYWTTVSKADHDTLIRIGGFSRLAAMTNRIRKLDSAGVLVVNCGDNLTGRYYGLFGGEPIWTALNLMAVEMATLGNHEFDDGSSGLAKDLSFCHFTMIESNLSPISGNPLAGRFPVSRIIYRAGLKIGLLGLITPTLSSSVRKGMAVEVGTDLPAVVRPLVKNLRDQEGVDLVIILSHCGLEADSALASQVEGIDLIVAGHSHHLLLKGKEMVVPHADGRKTLITQVGAYSVYLGDLAMTVDSGRVLSWLWNPIRIADTLPTDSSMDSLIQKWHDRMPPSRVITQTTVPLDPRIGGRGETESPLANLLCDVLRDEFHTDIAVINNGGIRGIRVFPPGPITDQDLQEILPFKNDVAILHLTGAAVKRMLEWSAVHFTEGGGGYLLVSGLRYTLRQGAAAMEIATDEKEQPTGIKKEGDRIEGLQVHGGDGHYHPCEPSRNYSLATNSYLADGGDFYIMLQEITDRDPQKINFTEAIQRALGERKEWSPRTDGRVRSAP